MPNRLSNALSLLLLVLGGIALAAPAALAQSRDDGAPAETLGVGDAVRASVWGPAALYHNPAGLSRVPVMLVQGGYTYLDGGPGHALQAAAIDARTSDIVSLAVAYNYYTGERDGFSRFGHQLRFGLGTVYRGSDVALYAGVAGRYLDLRFRPLTDGGPVPAHGDADHWNVDAGLILDFAQRIRFGVAAHNLVDQPHPDLARVLGVGMSFVFDTLDVSANMDLDITGRGERTIRSYAFGAEYGFANMFQARLGLVIDLVRDEERLTTGFGWSSSEFAVDIAWSTAVAEPTDMIFALSVRMVPGF